MALVKRNDGNFLINLDPIQWGTPRMARSLFRVDIMRAQNIAAQLRNAGVACYASQDGGTEDDPAFKPPTGQVDLSVVWPGDWRIEIERVSENRFVHSFIDSTGSQQSVIGPTPQAVVDKLAGRFDFESKKYVASITSVPETPVAIAEAPVDETPKKFLRPGSRTGTPYTADEAAHLAAQRAARETPETPPIEVEYLNFYNNSLNAKITERKAKDADFRGWMVREGLLHQHNAMEAENARN